MDIAIRKKIKPLADLGKITAALKKKGNIVVHCHGVFDLVHLGHIRYLHAAKKEGDILIVTLTADTFVKRGPGRPVFNENLRAENLAALAVTDYVAVVHEATAMEAIAVIRPNVYAKGPDYKEKDKDITGMITTEEKKVKAVGGRLVITDDITFSSSQLLNTYFDSWPEKTQTYLRKLKKAYHINDVLKELGKIARLKVLVVGDAIVDQYAYASPMGKSSKEPLVVHLYQSQESFAGGALATANHVASAGAKVNLLTVLGKQDAWHEFIAKHLAKTIRTTYYFRPDAGTTIKRRYVSETQNRKVFEVYYMNDLPLPEKVEDRIDAYLHKHVGDYDLVIVNDFGHGFLTPTLIKTITQRAKKLAINVQTNSANMGFNLVTKYPKADFVCIDEQELRFAMHDQRGEIQPLMKRLQKQLKSQMIIATRGSKGSLSLSAEHGFVQTPAFAPHVVDPVGAGDAFFAFTAPAWAAGVDAPLLCFIGNAVGSLAVQIVGNRETVQKVDLIKFMTRLLK